MITVKFNQEESDFLIKEFNVKTDSSLQFEFTEEQAAEIQDICLDIDCEEHSTEDGNIKRGRIAEDVYYTILAAWPKGSDWVNYLKISDNI